MKTLTVCSKSMPDVNLYDEVICESCKSVMNVKRNVLGPRNMAEQMNNIKVLHDSFTCPNIDEAWHIQLVQLRNLIKSTPSRNISELLEEEVNEIIYTRTPTKENICIRNL